MLPINPIEKHILLLRLTEELETSIDFGEKAQMDPTSEQRQWLARVGALLGRVSNEKKIQFSAQKGTLIQYCKFGMNAIKGMVLDSIEELKLDLEIDGRTDIGTAYPAGDTYRFFADLKAIIDKAQSSILIVDPYFDGSSFDAYLSSAATSREVKILSNKYVKDIDTYVQKHTLQYSSRIEIRKSNELHDRVIFIDSNEAWIVGGSIKDAGKKTTYLIPLASPLASEKKKIYLDIWTHANPV